MKTRFSEAIKLKDGMFYNLPYHQARMDKTLAAFGGTEVKLTEILPEIPVHARHGTFKCRVVYNCITIESVEFIPHSFRKVITVGIVGNDDIEYGYKYADRSQLDKLLCQTGCDDMIIVKRGLITDAFSSNLVFESTCGLFTPADCLLPGTKRQSLLDVGRIEEKRIGLVDIGSYDRIRFINAMTDLEDNVHIESKNIKFLL